MMREGRPVSHNFEQSCNRECVDSVWYGPRARKHLWNTCGTEFPLAGPWTWVYHACNNAHGLHMSAEDGGFCYWNGPEEGDAHIEVFLGSGECPDWCSTEFSHSQMQETCEKVTDCMFCCESQAIFTNRAYHYSAQLMLAGLSVLLLTIPSAI
eukprot:gnl/TRDRNA2_/TRDRNA2_120118_c0_seq1.p1 gnl/TRDRNA2_/TRDRNA2_120118_c0~~gnl/TRDRNA2_/TRDRNA2_120118_c0_seq1.p1  ORF type:complete len:153 (+),score=2.06 gnl/TRDRNA2_/TRDRNA2_120118_c0_seq1:3-461(+)